VSSLRQEPPPAATPASPSRQERTNRGNSAAAPAPQVVKPIVKAQKAQEKNPGKAQAPAPGASPRKDRWNAAQIVKFMEAHPSRAYFSQFFAQGGFVNGIEVGVADGRFTEHMLLAGRPKLWRMCEPFPNPALISRYPPAGKKKTSEEQERYKKDRAEQAKELSTPWSERGVGKGTELVFMEHFSTDKEFLDSVPKGTVDFVYLDGAHDYENVKKELEPFWEMMAPGGVLAGHDYQNHGQKPLKCNGCDNIPRAAKYTENGIKHGKSPTGVAANMNKVVKAVQEWVVENHPELQLHHTMENFTRESLVADGLDYDLVITNTRNPSWYFIKGA